VTLARHRLAAQAVTGIVAELDAPIGSHRGHYGREP
jgi:hypothetical protein